MLPNICVRKVMGLVAQTTYFNSKWQITWFHLQSNFTSPPFSVMLLCTAGRILLGCPNSKLHGFTFKVISLHHPFQWCFYVLLEIFFLDTPKFHCFRQLDSFHIFEMAPLDDPLELGKKNHHTEQEQGNREIFPGQQCSMKPGTTGHLECCEQMYCHGEAATICPAITLISSHSLRDTYSAGSSHRFADWLSGSVIRIWCWQWSSQLWLLTVLFFFGNIHWFLWCLVSGSYRKNPMCHHKRMNPIILPPAMGK